MSTILSLDLVTEDGNNLLARIDDDEVLVGRAPAPKGVAIQSMSVSATHGKFVRFQDFWFYRDLQSTNGTWFSSWMIPPDGFHILKEGDLLILANTALRVRLHFNLAPERTKKMAEPCLFIFWQDRLRSVLPLPQYGQSITVGGLESSVDLPAHFNENNLFIIKAEGRNCLFESHQAGTTITHNKTIISPSARVQLNDRDNIICGQMIIAFSAGYQDIHAESLESDIGTFIDPSARYSKKLLASSGFGQLLEDTGHDRREVIKTEGIVRQVQTSDRLDVQAVVGDRIIYLIGFLALVITLILFFWYLLL